MGSLQEYFRFYQFPTGRRLFAMREVARRARARDLDSIRELAAAAVQQAEKAADVESAWRRSRSTSEGRRRRAAEIDNALDRVLGGMASHLSGMTHAFGEDGIGAKAQALTQRLFPEGAAVITRMTFENELAAAESILRDLQGPFAGEAREVGLGPFIDKLVEQTRAFRQALTEISTREISYDAVRSVQAEGQEAMLRVIATLLGTFPGPREEHEAVRQELLEPVVLQNRYLAQRFANRRGISDIDPTTGEELVDEPDPSPDSAAQAPAEG